MKNSNKPAMPATTKIQTHSPRGSGYPSHEEVSYSGLTKREQACITLGIPETGDEELDAIIKKSERKRFAMHAMQGNMAARNLNWKDCDVEYMARMAV